MDPKDWDKIVDKYHEHIVSPFAKDANNPIKKIISSLPASSKQSVLNAGCGTGPLIKLLSKEFKHVVAFDFSPKMIEIARTKQTDNTDIFEHNILKASKLGKFDVVVAVNSILMPSLDEVDKAFNEISNTIKKGGYFIGIFPSMESDIYRALILYEYKRAHGISEKKAMKEVRYELGIEDYDFLFGFYTENGTQKNYYLPTLKYRLEKAKLVVEKVERIEYSWKHNPDPKLKKSKAPKIWDWLVVCKKK